MADSQAIPVSFFIVNCLPTATTININRFRSRPDRRRFGPRKKLAILGHSRKDPGRRLVTVRDGEADRARRPPSPFTMGVPKTKVRTLAHSTAASRPIHAPDPPAETRRVARVSRSLTRPISSPTFFSAVVPRGGGGAPQGREEVRRREMALHPEGSGAGQDPQPAIQRRSQGARAEPPS